MTSTRTILGTCPTCGSTLPETRLLIEYDTGRGGRDAFAECRFCERVVHPR